MGIFQSTPKWAIIDGQQYDMTDLLKYHPGGNHIIKNVLGKDCTKQYREHHVTSCDIAMQKYKIN